MLDIADTATLCQSCRVNSDKGIVGLTGVAVDANHILIVISQQILEGRWRVLHDIRIDDECLRAPIFGTPVAVRVFKVVRDVIPVRMLVWGDQSLLYSLGTKLEAYITDIAMRMVNRVFKD